MGNSEEKLDYYFKVLSNRIRRNILLEEQRYWFKKRNGNGDQL